MYPVDIPINNNKTREDNFIIQKALDRVSEENKEEFIVFLKTEGFELKEGTTDNSNSDNFTPGQAYGLTKKSRFIAKISKQLSRKDESYRYNKQQ